MITKGVLTVLLATITAVPAHAKIIYTDEDLAVSYSEGGFGYGGYSGIWETQLPDVEVICGAVCQALGGTTTLNGTQIVRVVTQGPHPSIDKNEPDPVKAKTDCVANCAIQRTIHDNNCVIQSAQLRTKLSNMPAASAIGGGIVSRFLRKKFGGDIDTAPVWGAAAYGAASSEIDRKIADFNAGCAAMGAKSQNDCIIGTCKALFTAPLFLLWRRRQRDRPLKYASGANFL